MLQAHTSPAGVWQRLFLCKNVPTPAGCIACRLSYALNLASPTAILAGVGEGAEYGVLLRSGEYVEKARRSSFLLFDKTGTLTKGEPRLTDIKTGKLLHGARCFAVCKRYWKRFKALTCRSNTLNEETPHNGSENRHFRVLPGKR